MEQKWSLTITGYDEIFKNGVPESTFDYDIYFSFDDLESALDFISKFQENAVQYHKYNLEIY